MIQQKLLFKNQDELGIVLMGTEGTDNALNEEDAEAYQHVTVMHPLKRPDLQVLELIK